MSDVAVVNDRDKNRYEAHLGDQLAGFAEYQLTDQLVVFTHTEVDPSFEGKGVGSALAKYALSDVRDEGRRQVLPLCPFIKSYINRHHDEFGSMVYGAPKSTAKD